MRTILQGKNNISDSDNLNLKKIDQIKSFKNR